MLHSNSVNLPAIASSTPKLILPHTKNPTHLTLPFFPAATAREQVQRPPLALRNHLVVAPHRVCHHAATAPRVPLAPLQLWVVTEKRRMTAAKACGPTFRFIGFYAVNDADP